MNLFLDPRFTEPTVRVHTDGEVWRLIHFGIPTEMQRLQDRSQSHAALTDKQMQECAAGAVTFRTTEWIMGHLVHRVQAYANFVRSQWPQPLQSKHIDAAGMVTDTKRVVMLLCTQHPAPAVLLSHDQAVLCTGIQDASRAHNSALEVCSGWAMPLGLQVEPVLIGPVPLSTLGAAVLVFAAPIPSSDDPLPVSLTVDTVHTAVWTHVDALAGLLRSVTEVTFAKLASFMGPSRSMSVLFSPEVKVGATSAASVAVSASAPENALISFEYVVSRAARSTKHLRAAMMSSDAARVIQAQVDGMDLLCPAAFDVKAVMSSFADRMQRQGPHLCLGVTECLIKSIRVEWRAAQEIRQGHFRTAPTPVYYLQVILRQVQVVPGLP